MLFICLRSTIISIDHFLVIVTMLSFFLICSLKFLVSLPYECHIQNLVKNGTVVAMLRNDGRTDEGLSTSVDDERQLISKGHLSDSAYLKYACPCLINMATVQHKNNYHQCHEIYNFGRPFLSNHFRTIGCLIYA